MLAYFTHISRFFPICTIQNIGIFQESNISKIKTQNLNCPNISFDDQILLLRIQTKRIGRYLPQNTGSVVIFNTPNKSFMELLGKD